MQHGAYWIAKKPVGHGTNRLHTSVRSLRVLHDLGPPARGSVNHVETFTSVCNLYILVKYNIHLCIILTKQATYSNLQWLNQQAVVLI